MRMIGLLGGMSWESTAEYYRLANQLVAARLGGFHSARILLNSLDFADIERLQTEGDWAGAGVLLARSARALQDGGAEVVVLCTNTMHIVADEIQAAITVPFLHLADTTVKAVQSAGLRKVALLGTAFTMEQPFYRDRLHSHGLQILVPGEEDRASVHRIIYDELVLGVVRDESRQAYREVIGRLIDEGAEGIILGCTEIELLISAADSAVPVFPTTQLHVAAAVDFALQD